MTPTRLANRAVIRLAAQEPGEDVRGFLQGLVTNDVTGDLPVWAALLSAQGKVLFDFLIWADGADLLLDCEADGAETLVKRLSLYRLRRRIAIAVDPSLAVHWSIAASGGAVADPRLTDLGWRWLDAGQDGEAADATWLAHRLRRGVAEGRQELSDLLWLECNADLLHGVSFTKGCYVGQENTARMNWRQKVNRRLVVVPIAQSNRARQQVAWPDLELALDHLRVEDIPCYLRPAWMEL